MRGGEREGERDREGREGGELRGDGARGRGERDKQIEEKKEREGGREGTGRVRETESEKGER